MVTLTFIVVPHLIPKSLNSTPAANPNRALHSRICPYIDGSEALSFLALL